MKLINGSNFLFYILTYLFIISFIKSQNNTTPIYRCGEDTFKPIPLSEENIKPFDENNPHYRRSLDNAGQDGFKNFSIYLDLTNFNYELELYNLSSIKNLLEQGMIKAVETLQKLLRVKPVANYAFKDQQILNILISK